MGMTLARLLILAGAGTFAVGAVLIAGATTGVAVAVTGAYLVGCGVFGVDVDA